MLISFVVRLAPAALSAGVLAGEVEHVQTGERGQFRDAVELCTWCAQHHATVPLPREDRIDLHVLPAVPADFGDTP